MDLFDFNHDGEVSDLERIMGLAAVLSEANPDVEISVTVDEDENYESMTHDELEDRLDELRTQRDTLECEEPDDLDIVPCYDEHQNEYNQTYRAGHKAAHQNCYYAGKTCKLDWGKCCVYHPVVWRSYDSQNEHHNLIRKKC